jgi:hypothetical protein
MAETFKDRDEHRGNPAPHLGQDHHEKSQIKAHAGRDEESQSAQSGDPDYHEQQQQPADVTRRAQHDIEAGSVTNRDKRPEELEDAVEDLDNGLAVKPD